MSARIVVGVVGKVTATNAKTREYIGRLIRKSGCVLQMAMADGLISFSPDAGHREAVDAWGTKMDLQQIVDLCSALNVIMRRCAPRLKESHCTFYASQIAKAMRDDRTVLQQLQVWSADIKSTIRRDTSTLMWALRELEYTGAYEVDRFSSHAFGPTLQCVWRSCANFVVIVDHDGCARLDAAQGQLGPITETALFSPPSPAVAPTAAGGPSTGSGAPAVPSALHLWQPNPMLELAEFDESLTGATDASLSQLQAKLEEERAELLDKFRQLGLEIATKRKELGAAVRESKEAEQATIDAIKVHAEAKTVVQMRDGELSAIISAQHEVSSLQTSAVLKLQAVQNKKSNVLSVNAIDSSEMERALKAAIKAQRFDNARELLVELEESVVGEDVRARLQRYRTALQGALMTAEAMEGID